jgi:CDP-diacylglycerol--serine O-phosphatidyltransferase
MGIDGKPPLQPTERATARLQPIQLLPNLMTLAALCAGLSAMRFAFVGEMVLSVALIALAAVLDALDGATARLLKSETALGAELDSLADFVNFGVAPGLLLYHWALTDNSKAGWIAVLIYAICCALRLGRYNIESRAKGPEKSLYFQGVPAPGGALLVLMPLVLSEVFATPFGGFLPITVELWLVLIGLLMISRFATPSPKLLRVPRDKAMFLMVGVVAFIATAFTWPWRVLLAAEMTYLGLLVVFALRSRKHDMTGSKK